GGWGLGVGSITTVTLSANNPSSPINPYSPIPVLSLGQLFVNPDQLLLGREIDLDPSARTVADDSYARGEQELQSIFGSARVNIDRLRRRRFARMRIPLGRRRPDRLGLAHPKT